VTGSFMARSMKGERATGRVGSGGPAANAGLVCAGISDGLTNRKAATAATSGRSRPRRPAGFCRREMQKKPVMVFDGVLLKNCSLCLYPTVLVARFSLVVVRLFAKSRAKYV